MSEGEPKAQPAAQAGPSGEAAGVGLEVGGVHSKDGRPGLSPRDATCSHARQRSAGAGNGSQEIRIPQKLRKLQHALYRKAKVQAEYSAVKRLGKPDTGNPSVRFDEGSESDGHWHMPFIPSAPAYSTGGASVGFNPLKTASPPETCPKRLPPAERTRFVCRLSRVHHNSRGHRFRHWS